MRYLINFKQIDTIPFLNDSIKQQITSTYVIQPALQILKLSKMRLVLYKFENKKNQHKPQTEI